MKRIHILRVEDEARRFALLIDAVRLDGGRVGWLDLSGPAEAPEALAAAASVGALRAVAAGSGHTVSVKPLAGEPVLRDLLRQHFLGCRVVLVTGTVEAPLLDLNGERWVVSAAGRSTAYSTEELVAALRKPRPFKA